jgi:hypothetical protein
MSVIISGSARIADIAGTHDPGEVIENPSDALLALAVAGTLDPETGEPYCTLVGAPEPTPPVAVEAPPETET